MSLRCKCSCDRLLINQLTLSFSAAPLVRIIFDQRAPVDTGCLAFFCPLELDLVWRFDSPAL